MVKSTTGKNDVHRFWRQDWFVCVCENHCPAPFLRNIDVCPSEHSSRYVDPIIGHGFDSYVAEMPGGLACPATEFGDDDVRERAFPSNLLYVRRNQTPRFLGHRLDNRVKY